MKSIVFVCADQNNKEKMNQKDMQNIFKLQEGYYTKLFKMLKKFMLTSGLALPHPNCDIFLMSLLRVAANIAISTNLGLKDFVRLADSMYYDELARFAGKAQLTNGQKIESISKEELKAIENMQFIINDEKNQESFAEFHKNIVGKVPSDLGFSLQTISDSQATKKSSIIEESSNDQLAEFVKRKKTTPLN